MDKVPTTRLFIGSLPYKFNEGQLLSLFVPFGRIISIQIVHNQWGKSRGIGFVEFDNLDSAIDAKVKMHNYMVEDRTIIVDYAEPDPFKTPEGQARHEEALERHPQRRQQSNYSSSPSTNNSRQSKWNQSRKFSSSSPSKPKHSRQSVYESRNFHSKVGSKFSKRNRGK